MTTTDPALTRDYDNASENTDTDVAQHPQTDTEHKASEHKPSVNVSEVERAISVAIGAIVVAKGLTRLSIPALLIVGAGAAMINRGLSGHCPLYEKLGIDGVDSAEPA
jgi:uncharacterized membrane protein